MNMSRVAFNHGTCNLRTGFKGSDGGERIVRVVVSFFLGFWEVLMYCFNYLLLAS
jgi:hypothetical protein